MPVEPNTAAARHDVCVVGSSNLDLVVTTPRHPAPGETLLGTSYHEYPGGKGLNQVVAVTRAGGAAAFVSALGDDAAGDQLADVLAGEGITADAVQRIAGTATGRALITVDQAGENSIVVIPGANALLRPAPLPDANVVLSQLEISIDVVVDAFAQARALGRLTILNPAPAAELPEELLRSASIVIPNEHEREQLGGIDRLFEFGVTAVITTLGSRGVDVETLAGRQHVSSPSRSARSIPPAPATPSVARSPWRSPKDPTRSPRRASPQLPERSPLLEPERCRHCRGAPRSTSCWRRSAAGDGSRQQACTRPIWRPCTQARPQLDAA